MTTCSSTEVMHGSLLYTAGHRSKASHSNARGLAGGVTQKPLSRCGPWTPGHHSGWGGGTHRDPSAFPGVTCQAGTQTRQPQGNETHTDMPGITPTLPTQTRPETPNRTHRHARRQKHNLGWGPAPCRAGDSHSGREAETRRESDAGAEETLPPLGGHRLQPPTSPLLPLGFPGGLSSGSSCLSHSGSLWVRLYLHLRLSFSASVFLCFKPLRLFRLSLSLKIPLTLHLCGSLSLSLCFFVSLCLSASLSLHPTAF